jgi:hypothetical protein
MAWQFEWGTQKCEKFVKICNVIGGLLLITLGVLRFVYNDQLKNFLSVILSIYYMYEQKSPLFLLKFPY